MFEDAVLLLPERFRAEAISAGGENTEEIRLRIGQTPCLMWAGGMAHLAGEVSERDIRILLEKASASSLYAAADAIRSGVLCYKGLRIGIAGEGFEDAHGLGFRRCTSVNIRIPHRINGICDKAAAALYKGGFRNTLILSPPGGGKTTALRDMLRLLSYSGHRIGVIDERREIAPEGVKDFFPGCDIISGISKERSAAMLIKGMNPELIATDEITTAADAGAIGDIFGCGVGILSTAHAENEHDLKKRGIYGELLERGAFSCAVIIERHGEERCCRWTEL